MEGLAGLIAKASKTGALSHPVALTAFTEILPALCVVVAIIVFELELPVHPLGSVQQ